MLHISEEFFPLTNLGQVSLPAPGSAGLSVCLSVWVPVLLMMGR